MLELISVVIALASLSLTILLERKKITAEYRQIREEMRVKAAYKQKAALESHSPKPVIVPTVEQHRAASKDFQPIILQVLKTFAAVIGASFSFVFIVALFYGAFKLSTNGFFYATLFWGSMLAGLVYGVMSLRHRTWGYILKFLGVVALICFILVVIFNVVGN